MLSRPWWLGMAGGAGAKAGGRVSLDMTAAATRLSAGGP